LIDSPEQIADDPYGQGWLIKLRIDDLNDFDEALTAEEYSEQVEGV